MAEFCQECSYEMWGCDTGDFANPNMEESNKEGLYISALCESCGYILVDFKGFRVSKKDSEHSPNATWWEMRDDGKTGINLADYPWATTNNE